MITLGAGEAFLPSQLNETFLTGFLIRESLRKFQEIHEYHLGIRTFVPVPSLPLSPHFSRATYESRYVCNNKAVPHEKLSDPLHVLGGH